MLFVIYIYNMLIYNIVFTINVAFLLLTHFQGIFLCVTIWLLGISCKCVCVCLFVNIIYKMFKAALYPSLSTSISFLFEFHAPFCSSLSLSLFFFVSVCLSLSHALYTILGRRRNSCRTK